MIVFYHELDEFFITAKNTESDLKRCSSIESDVSSCLGSSCFCLLGKMK